MCIFYAVLILFKHLNFKGYNQWDLKRHTHMMERGEKEIKKSLYDKLVNILRIEVGFFFRCFNEISMSIT